MSYEPDCCQAGRVLQATEAPSKVCHVKAKTTHLAQGGYSPQFRIGVCCWVPGNLTLFQTKETQFGYPVPNKMVKIDTLLQNVRRSLPLNRKWRFWVNMQRDTSRNSNSLFAAWFLQKKYTLTPTMFQSQNGQKYTLFQTEMLICRPCSRLREATTTPCWAEHPRIAHTCAHIWSALVELPQHALTPPGCCLCQWVCLLFIGGIAHFVSLNLGLSAVSLSEHLLTLVCPFICPFATTGLSIHPSRNLSANYLYLFIHLCLCYPVSRASSVKFSSYFLGRRKRGSARRVCLHVSCPCFYRG